MQQRKVRRAVPDPLVLRRRSLAIVVIANHERKHVSAWSVKVESLKDRPSHG